MKVLKNYAPYLTQGYKASHTANDIVGRKGNGNVLDTIVAIDDGEVIQVINTCNVNTNGKDGHKLDTSNPGNLVKIKHANGYVSRYLHGQYKSVKVKVGDKVKAGQEIMYMGNTGYSFGGHLHFDIWLNGTKIDPYDYVFKSKTFSALPKPVDRDETTEQIEVKTSDLRCRTGHSTNDAVIGFIPKGIYNILYTYKDNIYMWYEVEKDKWIASDGTWATVLPAKVEEPIVEPVEKPIEEPIVTDEPEGQERKNALLWFVEVIVEFIKKLFKHGKSDKME